MVHQCSKCKKTFKHKYLLDRHYNRKTKCKEPFIEQLSQSDILNEKIVSLDSKLKNTNIELQDTKTKLKETEQKVTDLFSQIDPATQDKTCKFCLKLLNRFYNSKINSFENHICLNLGALKIRF